MVFKKTIDVQAAVAIAASEAIAAKTQGTFAVGGLMLDQHGNVLQSLHSNVIKHGLIRDAAFFDWLESHLDGLLARTINADGSSLDFHHRDAFHYHLYNSRALLDLVAYTLSRDKPNAPYFRKKKPQ